MTIHFHIEYGTMFGEQLVLNIQEDDEEKLKLPMATLNGKEWSVDWCVKQPAKAYTYYYSVERDGVVVKTEWLLVKHRLELTALKANNLTQYDHWKVIPEDAYLYSSAFTDCINHQAPEEMKEQNEAKTVRLVVRAPQLRDGDRLGVVGADNLLGAWNAKKMLKMTQHSYNEWVAELDAAHLQTRHMEFKFVAYNEKKDSLIWETSMNRTIDLPEMKAGDAITYDLDQAFFALYNRKLAGTQVPVFSLRSEKSAGVGDFGDLKTMIDLVASTGQKVLQLLPINDTTITHTWTDSYPYSCISVQTLLARLRSSSSRIILRMRRWLGVTSTYSSSLMYSRASSRLNTTGGTIFAFSSAPEARMLVSFLDLVTLITMSLSLADSPTTWPA